jgi:sialic acid synthase SpsE
MFNFGLTLHSDNPNDPEFRKLKPKYLEPVLGRKAKRDIARGTPLSWDILE